MFIESVIFASEVSIGSFRLRLLNLFYSCVSNSCFCTLKFLRCGRFLRLTIRKRSSLTLIDNFALDNLWSLRVLNWFITEALVNNESLFDSM